jgi:hypothetical protein
MTVHWELVDNPGYTGEPRIMEPVCHDRSPFLTIRCSLCHGPNHLHETQLIGVPNSAELVMRCAFCRGELYVPPPFLREAFAQMRADGWIA